VVGLAALQAVVASLETLARDLDPSVWEPADLVAGLEVAARGVKMLDACRTVLAGRVDECGLHRERGHLSTAHLVAATSGSTLREAKDTIETAKRLSDQSELDRAFRSGAVSADQASESGRSLDRQGPGNA
jgi:hypothetical protein